MGVEFTGRVQMRLKKSGRFKKRASLITIALLIAVAPMAASAAGSDNSSGAPLNKKEIQKQEEQQFLREHSDSSGKTRPDLWRKGVEQQKHMQVAPYIGWHPTKKNQGKPVTATQTNTH
jgi:hypothetical protein